MLMWFYSVLLLTHLSSTVKSCDCYRFLTTEAMAQSQE